MMLTHQFSLVAKRWAQNYVLYIYISLLQKLPGETSICVEPEPPMSETWATGTFVDMARSPFWSHLIFDLITQIFFLRCPLTLKLTQRNLQKGIWNTKKHVEHHINSQVDVGTSVKDMFQQNRPPCVLNNQQSWQNNWMVCWKLRNVER